MDLGHLHPISGDVDTRFPQWSIQETRDLLMLRAEVDPTFMETKHNKLLWEVISTKMEERGYNRSAEQCKCKWKNLESRYKGCETMEHEGMRQHFPFYNELQAIFTNRMQRLLWIEVEGVASGSKKRVMQFSSNDVDRTSGTCKNKGKAIKSNTRSNPSSASNIAITNLKEVLEKFMKQQMEREMQWMKRYETKEMERRMKKREWRQTMETLEKERILLNERWRKREEQRRMRDESREEKRDALVTTLLNTLRS